MSYKPQRTFNGQPGEASADSQGPLYLSADIDEINKMFDPNATHSGSAQEQGGISKANLNFTITNDYDNTEKSKVTTAYTHANTTNANPHSTDAELVPIDTIEGLTGANVQTALGSLNTKITTHESTYAGSIDHVTFDSSDGKFKFYKVSDHTTPVYTIDTALEKVVTNFTYDRTTRCLILTHPDGTTESVPLSDLVTEYDFVNTDDISFSVSNHQVSATISTSYKTELTQLKNDAEAAKNNANTYQGLAKSYAVGDETARAGSSTDNAQYYKTQAGTSASNANRDALISEGYAVGSQGGTEQQSGTYYHNNAKYYKEQASDKADNASTSATNAKSWAVGPSATETSGTDTNNAKYWCEQAEQVAGADMTKSVYDPTTGGVVHPVETAGGIPAYVSANAKVVYVTTENTYAQVLAYFNANKNILLKVTNSSTTKIYPLIEYTGTQFEFYEYENGEGDTEYRDKVGYILTSSGWSIETGWPVQYRKNLVTSFQATPDDSHYPSEKLVKDSLDGLENISGSLYVNDKVFVDCDSATQHTVSATIGSNSYRCGDADLSGYVDSVDASYVSAYLNGSRTFTSLQKVCADFDADGKITSTDQARILQFTVNLYTPPYLYVTYAELTGVSANATIISISGITYGKAQMLENGLLAIYSDTALTSGTAITVTYTDGIEVENVGNKVTGLSSSSTDVQYPSAKCVYDKFASGAIAYYTTAPTADNTDGIKIVVLSSEPATKYSGWLYLITG